MKFIPFIFVLVIFGCSPSGSEQESVVVTDSLNKPIDSMATAKPLEETEAQEADRVAKEKFEEDEKVFKELNQYDGKYALQTESEGAEGKLELKYTGDKMFKFKLDLTALDICDGHIEGELFMDRTQHGIYRIDNCMLHFNFTGYYPQSGYIVEIEQEETCSRMKGDCIFSGKYLSGVAEQGK